MGFGILEAQQSQEQLNDEASEIAEQELKQSYLDAGVNAGWLKRDMDIYEKNGQFDKVKVCQEQLEEMLNIQEKCKKSLGYEPEFDDGLFDKDDIPEELREFANASVSKADPEPEPVAEQTVAGISRAEPEPVAEQTVAGISRAEPQNTTEQDIEDIENLHNANKAQSFNSKSRFLSDDEYHNLFDNVGRISTSIDKQKRVVYFNDSTQLLEKTDSIIVKSRNQTDSARKLVLVAKAKGWNNVTFQGNSSFLENAYYQAITNGLTVRPLSEEQRTFFESVHNKYKLQEPFLNKKTLEEMEKEQAEKKQDLSQIRNADIEPEKKPEPAEQKKEERRPRRQSS